MTARTKARKRALDVLFEADLRRQPLTVVLEQRRASSEAPVQDYTVTLVTGVAGALADIDALIGRHSRDWSLERMPAVDRNLLRVATWELLHNPEVPVAVVIDEAVQLATELSTDESPSFVNGVLGAIAASLAGS